MLNELFDDAKKVICATQAESRLFRHSESSTQNESKERHQFLTSHISKHHQTHALYS